MSRGTWADEVVAALASDEPWRALEERPDLGEGVEVEVEVRIAEGTPVGRWTQQLAEVDRTFRHVTRLAELEAVPLTVEHHVEEGRPPLRPEEVVLEAPQQRRRRRRMAVRIDDGLLLESVQRGSARFRFDASERIEKALQSSGLKIILTFATLLGGGWTVHEIAVDEEETKVQLPSKGGVNVEAPEKTQILIKRDGQTIVLSVDPKK